MFKIERKGYSIAQVDEYLKNMNASYNSALAEQKERIAELKAQVTALQKETETFRAQKSQVSKAILSAVAKAEEIDRLSQIKYNQEIAQLKAFHEKWTQYYNKILDRYPLDDKLAAAGKFSAQMGKILAAAGHPERDTLATATTATAPDNAEKETRIGYITVKTSGQSEDNDDQLLQNMVPGADPESPIVSGIFDPMERVTRYLNAEKRAAKPQQHTEQQSVQLQQMPRQTAQGDDYSDRSASGFSFEEALNPKEDLSDIMRDLGLLMDE